MKIALCPWRGVELVLPRGVSDAAGRAFLDSRREWMEQAWARLRQRVPEAFECTAPRTLSLPALGCSWQLHYEPGRQRLREQDAALFLPGPAEAGVARRILKPWLMDRARHHLPEQLARLSEVTGLAYARLQVRDQRSRWGSCSQRGTISLNFRILFHRPAVRDYLILHELAHTRHMNHGPGFRALMSRLEPQWQALDRELSQPAGGIPGWLGW
ncbi:M48 family metallopeptidase [Natronospira bacteriovora]|uniref:SprT family zinc-dependent metalloprotease n=1 Tax=Natronospira bacteriovora TaxID=3069753 RepID=A0ABU0W9G1_9GAMM|nr:SprT family zinc-dependent metalloprotease [Natronospira sp. AB-CW4]MDQ2070666.1 SprT family zinc-dependent metalloprotease [Natronospira sp. AB-CW4]